VFFATVINNLPELIMAGCWTVVVFWVGSKFGRWRAKRST
jgi:hypothetical protein